MNSLFYVAIVLFIGLSAACFQIAGAAASWSLVWLCFFGWMVHVIGNFIQDFFEIQIDDDDEQPPAQ